MTDVSHKFCAVPFNMLTLGSPMHAHYCCYGWLPRIVGDLMTMSLDECWNSADSQEIRRSILDGSFRYCDKSKCDYIVAGTLPDRQCLEEPWKSIVEQNKVTLTSSPSCWCLNYDMTCNLFCVTCRPQRVYTRDRAMVDRMFKIQDELISKLKANPAQDVEIHFNGSGEAFASPVFQRLLYETDGRALPNLRLSFGSNGTMFNRDTYAKMSKIHGNLHKIHFSIDAATKEVYEKVRRGAQWEPVRSNIGFLSDLLHHGKIKKAELHFCVHRLNYRDMPDFVRLCMEVDLPAHFQQAYKWYDDPFWNDALVCDEKHPEHPELLRMLKDPVFDWPKIDWAGLTGLRKKALAL